jgi:tetratricopeptide (TPR) repeat protein
MDRNNAVLQYLRAVQSDPNHGGAWNNLGSLIQSRFGDYQEIHAILFHVIFEAYVTLVHDMSSKTSTQVDDISFIIQQTSKSFKAQIKMWLLLSNEMDNDDGNGEQHLRRYFQCNELKLRNMIAELCFRIAIHLNPNTHSTAYNNLGKLLHVQGHSFLFTNEVITWNNKNNKMTDTKNQSDKLNNDDDDDENFENEAMETYKRALDISSTYAKAWFNLGLLQLKHHKNPVEVKVLFKSSHGSCCNNANGGGGDDDVTLSSTPVIESSHELKHATLFLSSSCGIFTSETSVADDQQQQQQQQHHHHHLTVNIRRSQAMLSFEKAYLSSENIHNFDVLFDSYLTLADLYLKTNIIISHENDLILLQHFKALNTVNDSREEEKEGRKVSTGGCSGSRLSFEAYKKNLLRCLKLDLMSESLQLFQKANHFNPKDQNVPWMIKFVEKQIKHIKKELLES